MPEQEEIARRLAAAAQHGDLDHLFRQGAPPPSMVALPQPLLIHSDNIQTVALLAALIYQAHGDLRDGPGLRECARRAIHLMGSTLAAFRDGEWQRMMEAVAHPPANGPSGPASDSSPRTPDTETTAPAASA